MAPNIEWKFWWIRKKLFEVKGKCNEMHFFVCHVLVKYYKVIFSENLIEVWFTQVDSTQKVRIWCFRLNFLFRFYLFWSTKIITKISTKTCEFVKKNSSVINVRSTLMFRSPFYFLLPFFLAYNWNKNLPLSLSLLHRRNSNVLPA